MNCPKCGFSNAYVGFSSVECMNKDCEHFKDVAGVVHGARDYVGAFPARQDITVLPADDPNKLRLGFVIREYIGQEIYRVKKDFSGLSGEEFYDQISLVPVFPDSGKPGSEYFETIKSRDGICVGYRVVAHGWNWMQGVIVADGGDFRFESEGGMMGFLRFGEDDRSCWVSTCWASKAALEKMSLDIKVE